MYSVTLGFDSAIDRIQSLPDSGFSSEALVTSVFTAEKTLRRTLRQLMVSSGFISTQAVSLQRMDATHEADEERPTC